MTPFITWRSSSCGPHHHVKPIVTWSLNHVTFIIMWPSSSSGAHYHMIPSIMWRPSSCGPRHQLAPIIIWHPSFCAALNHIIPFSSKALYHMALILVWHPSCDTHHHMPPFYRQRQTSCGTLNDMTPIIMWYPSHKPMPLGLPQLITQNKSSGTHSCWSLQTAPHSCWSLQAAPHSCWSLQGKQLSLKVFVEST